MLEKSIKPQLDGQLEARPIAMLVQVASQYDSTVYLETEGRRINAKSIMGMMSLAASLGSGLLQTDLTKNRRWLAWRLI